MHATDEHNNNIILRAGPAKTRILKFIKALAPIVLANKDLEIGNTDPGTNTAQ